LDTIGSQFVVAMPLFNDWSAAALLLPRIDDVLAASGLEAQVIVIDDASTDPSPTSFGRGEFKALAAVSVLRLRRNLGHQRAIAIGLAYIEEQVGCDAVILMDSDGEDAPSEIPELVARYNREGRSAVVFAERRKRAETPMFRVGYHAYRLLHLVLTGHGVRVGNFSVIPRRNLRGLVVVSELWNHYAAAVFRSRQPYVTVPTRRAARLDGRSHMNFVSLVVHGFSAISVYGDLVFVRLVVFASVLAGASAAALCAVVAIKLFTALAIPGWATVTSGLLLLVMLQAVLFVAALAFIGLGSRNQAPFVPARDYSHYIESMSVVSVPAAATRG
jgi:glycosyltransferase involved in cell wall biosynthesis